MKVGDFKAYDEAPLSSDIISPGKVTNGTKLEVLEQKDVNNITYAKGKNSFRQREGWFEQSSRRRD